MLYAWASFLAIRKMVHKRVNRLGFVSYNLELVLIVVLTVAVIGLCIYAD